MKAGPQSVHRAIAILAAFSDADPELSLTSIAARTGLPVSTTYRLAQALQHSGLLERAGDGDDRYRIGSGLVALAAPALHRLSVQTLAPHLQSLATDIEITASFGVVDHHDMLTVFSARPARRFCGNQLPGPRQPLARSAMGMAVLAFSRPAEQELALVRRRGYADGTGAQGAHVRAIAVPVLGRDGNAWGAVGVQALRRRLTDELVHDILPVIRRHANRIVRTDTPRHD
ncbi:IclR family transcriptional regulator [Mycobacterium sp. URHB0044]|uniref:IclR family transcriptional regulator n=1 Tax=Mycobacterium sp. URHB0044 TaxID=1380386 RepID=UPI000B27AE5B|nr:helix-turn-helix domain-containing protein [Mycobacterium sp. URHB0044]